VGSILKKDVRRWGFYFYVGARGELIPPASTLCGENKSEIVLLPRSES
jgi:hypothetical protein